MKDRRKYERVILALLSPVSYRFVFVFTFSQFRGHDYLGSWNGLVLVPLCDGLWGRDLLHHSLVSNFPMTNPSVKTLKGNRKNKCPERSYLL